MEIWRQAFYVLEINVKYSEFLLQKAILMVAKWVMFYVKKNIDRIVTYCEKIRLLADFPSIKTKNCYEEEIIHKKLQWQYQIQGNTILKFY
jgi:hypothetical protein